MRTITIVLLLICCFSLPAHSQTSWPECVSQSSDPDGDGYGYENNSTCVVSIQPPPPVNNNPTINQTNNAVCFDSDPIGDGWGWDGFQSCRVEPTTSDNTNGGPTSGTSSNTQINELDLIRSKFGAPESLYFPGGTRTAVGIFCPPFAQRPERVLYLFADGELRLLDGWGLWSGGWNADDNELNMLWREFNGAIGTVSSKVVISEGGVVVDGTRPCSWIGSN